jgi:hypothetical protein
VTLVYITWWICLWWQTSISYVCRWHRLSPWLMYPPLKTSKAWLRGSIPSPMSMKSDGVARILQGNQLRERKYDIYACTTSEGPTSLCSHYKEDMMCIFPATIWRYSPQPECHSNLQVARRTTIEAARRSSWKICEQGKADTASFLPKRTVSKITSAFLSLVSWIVNHILALKLNRCLFTYIKAFSARANLPYQTGGIEKILQMICRQPLSKECRWWSLTLHLLQISNMSAIFLVGYSTASCNPSNISKTSPSFAFQRDGGTQSTSGPRPPWHRLGWSVVPRLHNVGRPSEAAAADQLWDFLQINWPTLESKWNPPIFCSVNPQHLAGFKSISKKTKGRKSDANWRLAVPQQLSHCTIHHEGYPKIQFSESVSHCLIHGYPWN